VADPERAFTADEAKANEGRRIPPGAFLEFIRDSKGALFRNLDE